SSHQAKKLRTKSAPNLSNPSESQRRVRHKSPTQWNQGAFSKSKGSLGDKDEEQHAGEEGAAESAPTPEPGTSDESSEPPRRHASCSTLPSSAKRKSSNLKIWKDNLSRGAPSKERGKRRPRSPFQWFSGSSRSEESLHLSAMSPGPTDELSDENRLSPSAAATYQSPDSPLPASALRSALPGRRSPGRAKAEVHFACDSSEDEREKSKPKRPFAKPKEIRNPSPPKPKVTLPVQPKPPPPGSRPKGWLVQAILAQKQAEEELEKASKGEVKRQSPPKVNGDVEETPSTPTGGGNRPSGWLVKAIIAHGKAEEEAEKKEGEVETKAEQPRAASPGRPRGWLTKAIIAHGRAEEEAERQAVEEAEKTQESSKPELPSASTVPAATAPSPRPRGWLTKAIIAHGKAEEEAEKEAAEQKAESAKPAEPETPSSPNRPRGWLVKSIIAHGKAEDEREAAEKANGEQKTEVEPQVPPKDTPRVGKRRSWLVKSIIAFGKEEEAREEQAAQEGVPEIEINGEEKEEEERPPPVPPRRSLSRTVSIWEDDYQQGGQKVENKLLKPALRKSQSCSEAPKKGGSERLLQQPSASISSPPLLRKKLESVESYPETMGLLERRNQFKTTRIQLEEIDTTENPPKIGISLSVPDLRATHSAPSSPYYMQEDTIEIPTTIGSRYFRQLPSKSRDRFKKYWVVVDIPQDSIEGSLLEPPVEFSSAAGTDLDIPGFQITDFATSSSPDTREARRSSDGSLTSSRRRHRSMSLRRDIPLEFLLSVPTIRPPEDELLRQRRRSSQMSDDWTTSSLQSVSLPPSPNPACFSPSSTSLMPPSPGQITRSPSPLATHNKNLLFPTPPPRTIRTPSPAMRTRHRRSHSSHVTCCSTPVTTSSRKYTVCGVSTTTVSQSCPQYPILADTMQYVSPRPLVIASSPRKVIREVKSSLKGSNKVVRVKELRTSPLKIIHVMEPFQGNVPQGMIEAHTYEEFQVAEHQVA
ncbi:unnamed protein product, partial [Cyprideis torosa]